MIRFLLRLIGFLILAAGFVALVIDGTRSIAAGAATLTATAASWEAASPGTLASARGFVEQSGVPGGDAGFSALVAQPTFLVLGVVGIVLMLLGRRRRRVVGVAP